MTTLPTISPTANHSERSPERVRMDAETMHLGLSAEQVVEMLTDYRFALRKACHVARDAIAGKVMIVITQGPRRWGDVPMTANGQPDRRYRVKKCAV